MAFNTPPFSAHYGGGGEMSMLGVVGTLGTADTGGTAQILPIGVDPLTGAQYVEVLGTVTTNGAIIGISTYGTYGTTGASVFGTLVGGTSSGAGTEIFVTSLSIQIPSTAGSQNVSVGFGTNGGTFHQGTGAIFMGNFVAGGGISKFFDPPINSGTNAQLTYFQSGAGTISVNITYFTTASTL